MIHEFHIYEDSLIKIEIELKTIELRLYDEKRQKLKVGDYIRFISIEKPKHTVTCKIMDLHIYSSFKELHKCLSLLKCGYTMDNIETASYKDMDKYYSKKQQEKYGVIGIEVRTVG